MHPARGATSRWPTPRARSLAEHADRLGPRVRWVGDEEDAAHWADGLGLSRPHNRRNARLARACLQALGIAGGRRRRRPGRGGRSASTGSRAGSVDRGGGGGRVRRRQPVDQRAAGPGRPRGIGRTAGGPPRRRLRPGLDYGPLARASPATAPTLVVTLPDNGRRIGEAVVAAQAVGGGPVEVVDDADLAAAVATGLRLGPARRRRAALARRAQLRPVRRLPGAGRGVRRRRGRCGEVTARR